ncbi:acetyl-CoA carboxylase, carboxyltransferase subunit beta [Aneurinibacillus uraniidurans]|uniref:acetyl-CoA carboxylase, carboxyltransferase subunit beta n=1 Tax=Aneurinibacillus uraniidurans TaxID=2966586 RepID=UPI00234AB268|nr:acetyl-CoA carboxylase, carboxyltransferase subunit beta [Aneurinibacillus sp. B1]WCN37027.1 acetyl-CoA carboxylase, carboxyltransferase subunit beta [Aneurinibacillus sp. B1]
MQSTTPHFRFHKLAEVTTRPPQVIVCPTCHKLYQKSRLVEEVYTCECGFQFRLTAKNRIKTLLDPGSFIEWDAGITSKNPLDFKGYDDKLQKAMLTSGVKEGVITGIGTLRGQRVVVAVMEPLFMMGSMGSSIGEKITRAIEGATREQVPIFIFSASGGARMQEGVLSLMQMAKTSAALQRHSTAGLLYISILTHPTTGGVTASYAMLGDIILSEPGALIGFAGRRVIEQTIKQKLPDGFQSAEFLLEHGMLDAIVPRKQMRETLARFVALHRKQKEWKAYGS